MAMTEIPTAVIDADAHVVETEHTWDFLAPEDEKYRPKSVTVPDNPKERYWMINGRFRHRFVTALSSPELEAMTERTGRLLTYSQAARELDDVPARLDGMDELGLDIQVLHNTLWIQPVSEVPDVERALCQSWNRWLAEIHAKSSGRLYWSCVVPTSDPECAVEEMRFAHDHGAVALCLRPFEGDLVITDPAFYPLYEEATRLDMAVVLHLGNGSPELLRILQTRYPSSGWAPFRVPTVTAAMAILSSSVTSDFPTLRWGIIEASASWIPWLCHELRRRNRKAFGPESNPFVDHNMYVTAEYDDDLAYICANVGENVLLIGTDFGHTDASSEYDSIMKLRASDEISDSLKRNMLSANPAALYGLTEQAEQLVGHR